MDVLKNLAVFGDSILKGVVWDNTSMRYRILKDNCVSSVSPEIPYDIENKSKFRSTIIEGQRIMNNFLSTNKCDVALIEFGGNDCDFHWDEIAKNPDAEHLPRTPICVFEQTLINMINSIKERGIQPLLMSLPPINPALYFDFITRTGLSRENILRWLGDVTTIYHYQEMYSAAVTRIAYETKSLFIDIRKAFLMRHDFNTLICEDGIHPNEAGHSLIKQSFVRFAYNY